MPEFDLVVLGEILYVLRAPHATLLEGTRTLNCHCGGAEGNVAIGAARLGLRTAFVSKVCDNFIGRFTTETLRGCGVDTTGIVWTARGRMGVLYEEFGVPPRPSNNVYDRAHSSFTTLESGEIDWSHFRRAGAFYVSGVTAAVGPGARRLITHAVAEAKDAGMRFIFDGNFRSKLWSAGDAREFFDSILGSVDILFIKAADARQILGLEGEPEVLVERIRNQHGIDVVLMGLGSDGAVASDSTIHRSAAIKTDLVNRFGLGDAFSAGFLYGYFKDGLSAGLDYGIALAALKSTYTSENFSRITRDQVEQLIKATRDAGQDHSGEILR